MTKITRKTLCAIILIAFAAVVFTFFAIATRGGKNWDGASWFDYWGKGAPAAITVIEDQDEVQTKSAANSGLTHDSEFSEAVTAEIKQLPKPNVVLYSNLIYIECDATFSTAILCLRVYYGNPMGVRNNYFNVFVPSAQAPNFTGFEITYDEIRAKTGVGIFGFDFLVVGAGSFKDSEKALLTRYIMPEGETGGQMTLNGTHVKIPVPDTSFAPYETFYFNVNIGANDGSVTDTFDSNSTESNFLFEIVDDTDGQYIDVDLTALSFVNQIIPHCTVTAALKIRSGSYTFDVFYTVPDLHFGIIRLAAPTNISYANGTLSWGIVDDAEGYAVFDGDTLLKTTTETSLRIVDDDIEVGLHTLRIRALGNVGSALADEPELARLTPYNASARIIQYVAITFNIDGDSVTKFVPLGSTLGDYLYDVDVPNKLFGGWYYDSGFTDPANKSDKLDSDMTIYARLMDKEITERPLTWWEKNMWYWIGAAIILVVGLIVVGIVVGVKKQKV